nr:hypothetical protein pBo13 [Bovine gammaherpesvirus 4]
MRLDGKQHITGNHEQALMMFLGCFDGPVSNTYLDSDDMALIFFKTNHRTYHEGIQKYSNQVSLINGYSWPAAPK